MKKIAKVLTSLMMCFSVSGCVSNMYSRSASNNIESVCSECANVESIESLIDNIEIMMNKVKGVSGNYTLTNTKTTYDVEFDIITKDKRLNWDLSAKISYNDKDVKLYLKDGKFYVVYPNNGANVILKDSLTTMVKEIEETLDTLDATYDKENLNEVITGDKLEGFNFDKLKTEGTYVKNSDGSYIVTYANDGVEWQYVVTSNYLVKEVRSEAANFTSVLNIEYPKSVGIEYLNGLDFLTLDIDDAKSLLGVDNFAYLIDPDLESK